MTMPNKANTLDAERALPFQTERQWRGPNEFLR